MKKWLPLLILVYLLLLGCQNTATYDLSAQAQSETQDNFMNHKQLKKPAVPVHRNSNAKLSLSELRHKYADSFIIHGAANARKIALTFDDGPDVTYTPQILDILRENRVKATFFLVGFRAQAHPDIVRRIVAEGHVIGNHSYNHANPAKLSVKQFSDQVMHTQKILEQTSGFAPLLIRTPYGAINEEQLRWAMTQHFITVNWDIDSLDWKGLNATQVQHNILAHVHQGAIILQHSAGGAREDLTGSVKALPAVIQKLKADGYELVTVPQLLHVPPFQ